MFKKFSIALIFLSLIGSANAQYVNLSGNNEYIKQYVEASPENWDKSLMYVFYTNEPCSTCAEAMGMIYDIYEEYYLNQLSLFEINYAVNDEFQFRLSYELDQPLSVVLVRIRDGLSMGYYKIDNPQQWVGNPFYFKENLTTRINNFLNM